VGLSSAFVLLLIMESEEEEEEEGWGVDVQLRKTSPII